MFRVRLLAAFFSIALALCFLGLWSVHSQTALRRITNTTDEGKSLNPSLSGDGRIVAFESTEDLAHTGGGDHFRALRADVSTEPPTFAEMGGSRAVAPATSQDGSRIAFASKDNPLGTNLDGNSEIYLFDNGTLRQITNTSPGQIENRVVNGNFQPSISDDGRFIAFASNRDLAGLNPDANLEIYVYDAATQAFAQLTNSIGTVGATDAKISGNGARVAFIRDGGASPSTRRDLMIQDRTSAFAQLIAGSVDGLALTYGRAISDDGTRVVYSALTAANSSQVFLYDGRSGGQIRPITFLGSRATDVPLHPTISGDGSRIAFATRRSVLPNNTDSGVDLYTFDVPTGQTARVTNGPATATADVVSSLNDQGTLVAFNYPRILSGEVSNPDYANNTEIYLTATAARPAFGTLTVLNGASFGHEPATIKAVAPNSIAVGIGGALANSVEQAQRQQDGTFPRNVGGTTVTVNGRAAQIFFVSPTQVNFLVPPETEIGDATVVITNSDGFETRGTVAILRAAPGIFTYTGDGRGEGVVLDADTLQPGPFDPSNGQRRLIVFATGARNATQISVSIGGRFVTVESVIPSPNMPGMDEIHLLLPADLRGAGTVEMVVRADNRDSNPVTVTITGDTRRDLVINEVLADPPDGLAGDANHDGVRDTSQDEFVEIVNTTSNDIDISGYELLSRGTTDTLRHKFASNTILPAGGAIVVFGGGTFDASNAVFGGAQVVKASTGSLSLVNGSGVVTLRDTTGAVASLFSYGGSTGLNGDANQSLTRSPDITGSFTGHLSAPGNGGRAFSPGTRVDGSPFLSPAIARIEVTPSTATIFVGQQQQFTARAFDASGQELSGVIFFWQSGNTAVATINQSGVATGVSEGTTEIRASARGVQSAPATLTVNFVPRVLTRIEVTPNPASIPVSGGQQFTAKAFDQFNNEITGVAFAWASADPNIATIDQTGLALGVSQGQTTITASAQNVSGTATLTVTAPTVVINEVLADPPGSAGTDLQGDANHDGVRSGADDEFVELVNSTGAGLNISGWTMRTRATGGVTETLRHTFAANTTLPAGEAIVVFGGGTFDPLNAAFACAQVVKASSGGLSLTNSGLTITVRDSAGNLVTQFTYGTGTTLAADNDQSLTRSPDITGSFVQHTTATGADGRRFSPGARVTGAPFGPCPARLTSVTITPASQSVGVGQSTQFTAQAFDQFGNPLTGATITFASDNTNAATVDSVAFDPSTGIATATVTGHNPGTAHITAQATSGATTVTSSPATLTVNAAATFSVTGQVRDTSNNPVSGVLITFEMDFQGTLSATSTTTDANGNYSSGDLGCQNNVKVTPSKTGLTFTPSAVSFVNSSQCLTGNETANFTAATPPPGTLVISQIYAGGGNSGATYSHDYVEIFNSGTTTVDFSVTPYSIQYAGTGSAFGSTAASNKTNITTGTIAPGQYFLVEGATSGAIGAALPTPDATGSLAMAATAGKVALVVGTAALPAATCPGDDGTSPFNPSNATIADFVGYGGTASTVGHCYEGPGPAPAPSATTADFRKSGGCVDTNFNADDFLVAGPAPRNTASPINDCSAGIRPEITINDRALSESTTPANFTVTLSTASTLTVTVDYVTADGTATAGVDYTAVSGTLTFAPGETTKTINVPVINDTLDEANETYFVNLSNATNSTILDGQGQGTINDNDNAPTISINDVSVAEGDAGTTSATFNVTLSTASGQQVTVNYATADNTATTADADYQATSGTVTFTAGQTVQTVTVLVNGDTAFEANETFFVNLTTPTNATIADTQGQGTITNDDAAPPVPAFSINDVSVTEGNSGTKTVDFTVTLSMSPTQAVTVDYSTADGTATAGTDYQTASSTLTFNPGDPLTKTITITINGDTVVEPDETFFVNLTNPSSNAIITDSQGVGTITNDDTANLVISQIYGGGGLSTAVFTNDFIEIFNRGTTTVNFAVTPYSIQYAGAGSNFGGTTSSVKTDITSGTIAPGKYFLIRGVSGGAVGAALPTPDVNGSINLAAAAGKVALVAGTAALPAAICPGDDGTAPFNPNNATIADFLGYGSVVCYEGSAPAPAPSNTTADFRKAGGCTDTNDNAADFFVSTPSPRNSSSPANNCSAPTTPNLTINDVTVTEGNSGTVTATFTVSLSAPASGADVTFDIATQNNTALSGSDYVAKTLTNQILPAGQQTYSFTVTVNGDTAVEPDETFFVNVTNVAGATVVDGQGVGTIQNDDLPSLSINDVTQAEGNNGASTFSFTVSLSAPAPSAVTFDISTQDNTATTANNDYVARSLTSQTIAAGQQTYTFDVTVNGDLNIEPNETFFVNVTNIAGATAGDVQGQGTIQNDDTPALSINDVTLSEGNAGATTFSFNVHLSLPAPAGGVTFDIATADGTAQDDTPPTEDNDYVARSLTSQTIPEGAQDYTFDVTVNGDTLVEPDETFFVNLSNASSNAVINDAQGQGTITNDDTANLVISQVYGGGGNGGATYQNDFIEIFNRGTTTINFAVTPYSVQYVGATGNFGATTAGFKTDITSGTIAPGKYFLIQGATGGAVGALLPTADVTGNIALAATAGKVALVSGTTALPANSCPGDDLSTAPTNPSGNNIVDFVGYGSGATCYEGSGPAPAPSATTSDFRKAGGCTDTNDNAADFFVFTPSPRNSSSPANNCSAPTTPNLTINDVTVTEGNSGTVTATFTVSLSAPASGADVTFNIATQNNTAVSGASGDYIAKSLTNQIIPAGQQTYTFTVTVNGDVTLEPDESFFVNVTSVSGANLVDGQGVGTIQNDDFPTLTINDVSLNEGNSGTTTFTFTVSLSAPAAATVTFDVATADGTAQDGAPAGEDIDYVAKSETGRTITAGQQTATFTVSVIGDLTVEANETFFVNVTNVTGAIVGDAQGQGTITNDDVAAVSTDLEVAKSDSPDPVAIGSNITYTILLTNNGPATANNASLADTIPTNTTFQSLTVPAGWTCITPAVGGTGNVTCTRPTLASGASASFTLVVNVNAGTSSGTVITNTASASSDQSDTNTGNNSSTTTTTAVPAGTADLAVTKTDTPDPVAAGGDITYALTVTNNGPAAAANAALSDTIPTNTTFQSLTVPAGWTCITPAVGGTGSISCSKSTDLNVGQSAAFSLVVRVNATTSSGTTITNTANVSTSTSDAISTNNSATTTTTTRLPLLVISQIYTTGGASGATYNTDFIEIFNRDSVPINLSGFSVQYADSGTGTFTVIASLPNFTLAPRQYFLIQAGTSNAAVGLALPVTPDQTGTSTNMTGSAGKVAIVAGTAPLTSSNVNNPPLTVGAASPGCPTNASIVIDFVGYGTTASCYEGNGRAPAPSANTRAVLRNNGGCTDTNDNVADFTQATVTPRNSSTIKASCP